MILLGVGFSISLLSLAAPPWAAGANPITNNLALGSPKVGTGFAQ